MTDDIEITDDTDPPDAEPEGKDAEAQPKAQDDVVVPAADDSQPNPDASGGDEEVKP